MKKTLVIAMTGIAVLLFTNSQAFAASYQLNLEDDMGEGIILAEKKESTVSYKYDNINPDAGDFMTEAVFFPEATNSEIEYTGDNSTPSMQNLMAEGICLETFPELIVSR